MLNTVATLGIRIHAFGVKLDGLRAYGGKIASADSMTWSFIARRRPIKLPGCTHQTCANCFTWAHEWRRTRIEPLIERGA